MSEFDFNILATAIAKNSAKELKQIAKAFNLSYKNKTAFIKQVIDVDCDMLYSHILVIL
jgi:hypothetical protein